MVQALRRLEARVLSDFGVSFQSVPEISLYVIMELSVHGFRVYIFMVLLHAPRPISYDRGVIHRCGGEVL